MTTKRVNRVRNFCPNVLIAILLFGSSFSVGAQSVGPEYSGSEIDRDPAVARVYIDQVLRAREDSTPLLSEQTEELLGQALEFDPASSDAYFLLADTRIDEQGYARANIRNLSAAIGHDTWRAIAKFDGIIALAGLYNRIGAYRDAIDVLELVDEQDRMSADYLFQTATALYGANEQISGDVFAARGRRLFPSDPRFFVAYEFSDPIQTLATEQWLDLYESRSSEFLDAVYRYASLTEGDIRRRALNRYRRLGGDSPQSRILELPFVESLPEAWESIIESGGGELLDVIVEFYRFSRVRSDAAALSAVTAFARTLDGEVFVESSRDGFYTIRYSFSNGRVTQIGFDENTDGVEDLVVSFEEGRIVSAVIRVGDHKTIDVYTTVLEYAEYPFVSTVRFESDGRYRAYTAFDGRVRVPVFPAGSEVVYLTETTSRDRVDAFRLFPIERVRTIVDEESLSGRARIREESDGTATRFVHMDNGIPYRSVEDSNGDGVIDRVAFYRDGVPYGARRDLLGDGVFDAAERIVDNEITAIAVDTRGDSVLRFVMTFGDEMHRVWDFDGDGRVDAEQRILPDGSIRAGYATELGGAGVSVSDVRAFFEGAE